MVANPPDGAPQITPYLLYENVAATAEWLVKAFGFVETFRMEDRSGTVNHAELSMGKGNVMMGNPGPDYRSPKRLGGVTQVVYVYVDDVDAHFEAAASAGAVIVRPVADQFYGDRTYMAEDPEGHRWGSSQHIRDVAPGDMVQP
ncbi:MAG TPA: VOC family protein [Acidimicrobiales bacterium]|nr:VOC family protein [Acidimicrobiales bacterium]